MLNSTEYIDFTPYPLTVITRIITFLLGNPTTNLYLPPLLGVG